MIKHEDDGNDTIMTGGHYSYLVFKFSRQHNSLNAAMFHLRMFGKYFLCAGPALLFRGVRL